MTRSLEDMVKKRTKEIRQMLNAHKYTIYSWELRTIREDLAELLTSIDANVESQKQYAEALKLWQEQNKPPEKPKYQF